MTSAAYIPVLARSLPSPPDPSLDPYLDAAATCFARHGVTRVSIGDIAKEMGVSRTTVYRQVGSIDAALRLIIARDLHRFHQTVPAALEGATGPEGVVRVIAATIGFARANPVLTKLLRDEPAVLGELLGAEAARILQQAADIVTPALEVAIAAGLIRHHDPAALAHWIVRLTGALIVAPPPVDLDELLAAMLLPILEPARKTRAR